MENINRLDWKKYIPVPVFEECPEYVELYEKAWELAFSHRKEQEGMPKTPYMDEGFCDTQIWIWDSCFMALFCKWAPAVFPGVETLENFYKVLFDEGKLPFVTPREIEPEWTGATAGKPYQMKIHIADNPPLFAWAEVENALLSGDIERIKNLLYYKKYLQKHYEWFESRTEPETPDGVFVPTCLIAREEGYRWEGGRSGMDNTPRGRTGERATASRPNPPEMLWVDALCQQALSADQIAALFSIVGDKENEQLWRKRFFEKKEILNRLYWDEQDEFYYDLHEGSKQFYKVPTMASFWALTAGLAPEERARKMAEQLLNPNTFGGKVSFVSLARNDADFCEQGNYWRGSVWLPTAYAALCGLKRYGLFAVAHQTAKSLLEHVCKTYLQHEPHSIWECYSPTETKPALDEVGGFVRPDFCGWSALGPISVFLEFVLGFHTVNAFEKTVRWQLPENVSGKIGVRNLRFGEIVTDIVLDKNRVSVQTNRPYTLCINGCAYELKTGENSISL